MKVGILALGKGSRLAEELVVKPRPMVEIGGQPIIWQIMMHYTYFGFNEFVIPLGYKGEILKKYITDYADLNGHLTINLCTGEFIPRSGYRPDWKVELIDTGLKTMAGGLIKRLAPFLSDGTFLLTRVNGVTDNNFRDLLAFNRTLDKLKTLTYLRHPARYAHFFNEDNVAESTEKPQIGEGWINDAFLVFGLALFDYIEGDKMQWERGLSERLTADGQLMAYKHTSYWQCMDTLREKHILEPLWQGGHAPWVV